MSTLKRLAGDTVIYGMGHILPRIMTFVVLTPYLTNKFTNQADYGIFNEFYAYSTIILAIMVFRMDTAYFRYANNQDKVRSGIIYGTTFLPVLIISSIITVLMVVFSQRIASFLKYPNQGHYVTWFAFILALDAFTTLLYSKFRIDSRPFRFLSYRVLNAVMTVVALLFFLEVLPRYFPGAKSNLDALIGIKKDLDYAFFSNLVASGIVFIAMLPEMLKINYGFDKSMVKTIWKYTWPLTIVALAGMVNQSFAAPIQKWLLIGSNSDAMVQVGIYSAVAKLAIFLNLFTTAYNYAAEPFFFNNAAKDEKREMYGKAALAFTIVTSIVSLGIYLYIDILIHFIGKNYREGLYIVPILLLSYIMLGLYYNVSIWYKLSDRTMVGTWISFVGVFATLMSSFILIPWIGVAGSAWSTLICYGVMLVMGYRLGQKYFPVNYPVKKILTILGMTSFVFICAYILRDVVGLPTIILLVINTFLFLGFFYILWILELKTLISRLLAIRKVK